MGGVGDRDFVSRDEWQIVREVFDFEILVFDRHRGSDVDLHGEDAFESSTIFIEINEIGGRMAIDPVLVMVTLNEDPIVVPFSRLEFFLRHFLDDPGLAFGIDDDLFSGVTQDAPSFFFVEHAVVFRDVGDDVALVASDDIKIDFGSHLPAILNAAVPTGTDADFYADLEVANR